MLIDYLNMSEFEVKINNRPVHKTKDNLKWLVEYCLPYMTNTDLVELKTHIIKMENHRQEIKDASTQTLNNSGGGEEPNSN